MLRKTKQLGLIPESWKGRSRFDPSRPRKARRILEKFGIEMEKPKKRQWGEPATWLPPTVRIGGWGWDGEVLRMTRKELFQRVWSTPISTLSKEFGLADRGLAKACSRLHIPTPPRGYWAKRQAG